MDHQQPSELTPSLAASKIQKSWRSYTNKKIYKYYKDIILFKCKGNPARLLKAINPVESQLLECSAKVHLRFRLGGENFPPNIYYKVYAHGAVVDLNSFAPRDYSVLKRSDNPEEKKIKYEQYKNNKEAYQNQGWYLRIDNNGWRPISHKVFNKTDYVELFSANKIRYYHFKQEKRDEKVQKKQRLNKLRWIQNMYKNARKEEEDNVKNKFQQGKEQLPDAPNLADGGEQDGKQSDLFNISDEQRYKNYENYNQENQEDEELDSIEREFLDIPSDFNPLKDPKFIDMDEGQFDHEVKELIEWSKNLDYNEYVKDWFHLSTSNASEAFVVQPVHIPNSFGTSQAVLTHGSNPPKARFVYQ